MLRRLAIKDFILVDRLELEFGTGFGVLTGETGAGKSILVDALAFALGERADVGLIRAGGERAEVSAEFDLAGVPSVADWLREHDLDDSEGLLLRRVIDANGRSRAYLNGSPATLQQLKEVAEPLVDIHGQHAHQSLLREDAQRGILDSQGKLETLVEKVSSAWRAWRVASEKLENAKQNAASQVQERERLEWQIKESETLGFSLEEWNELGSEHKRLAHAASLLEGAHFSLSLLSEEEMSGEKRIDQALRRLDDLIDFDASLTDIAGLLRSIQSDLSEAILMLRRYVDRVDLDPKRLEEVERRIDAVLNHARKFRTTPEELPHLLTQWRERLAELREVGDIDALVAQEEAARNHYNTLAGQLSEKRSKTAKTLGAEVTRIMQQLALVNGRFEVALLPLETGGVHGLEKIEFRIGGLSGDVSRPLSKVASGGELSRISLAIQVIASQAASVPTLVFDEVDVGIGGGVAEIVGRLLHNLGEARQILCVTHLPQVAARANWQWQVVKEGDGHGVRSRVELLDDSARIEEIARMLGGVEITPITRKHAKEMLGR